MQDDKSKLKISVERAVTKVFDEALKALEIAVTDESQYKKIRSRILREGNDQIRALQREIDTKYEVTYKPNTNERIELGQGEK